MHRELETMLAEARHRENNHLHRELGDLQAEMQAMRVAAQGGDKRALEKPTEIIFLFDGTGDIEAWIRQCKSAKRLSRLTDRQLADISSSRLIGRAEAVFHEMPAASRFDFEAIEAVLTTAFEEDAFEANEWMSRHQYVSGEGVDVF